MNDISSFKLNLLNFSLFMIVDLFSVKVVGKAISTFAGICPRLDKSSYIYKSFSLFKNL
jgi:hypothetical protein